MGSANDRLHDRAIRHAIEISRYGKGLSDRIVTLLDSANADILARLAGGLAQIDERGAMLSPKARARLEKTLAEVSALNGAIYGQVHQKLADELTEFSATEATFEQKSLTTALAVDLDVSLPAPAMLRAIVTETPIDGHLLSSHVEALTQGRINRITQAVRIGMVQGESTDTIVRRIRGTQASRYTDGIIDKSRLYTDNLVRTSVNHVSNQAAQETWKANSHVVKGWQFHATLDRRTTPQCATKDGNVYPVGEGPIPPLHIRCRSISTGVTKSFRELGLDRDELTPSQRASMDGQVAGTTKYPEWLKAQSKEVQEDVLGQKRAQLFNSGKLSFDDLVRDNGSLKSLDELQQRFGDILNK